MRIMALDYGSKTVGVALSDELLMTAQPKEIIRRDRDGMIRKTLQRIEQLILENDVRIIVLGLPLNMDDSSGERARLSQDFGDRIMRRTGVPVIMSDERLTTVEADEMMDRMEIRPESRGKYVDMLAACVILRDYMENHPDELKAWKEGKLPE
ncbi:MAG: Holliday junction resolvase RuvX [Lachnospiraceae bacterium]|jgi:putative Holliday junction resolvase|nr:Holliday junction resolvase RuvX [Lachnospiraceae bacterium]